MNKRAISDEAKAAKKQLMLSAALDEFYEKGFTAARMDDIAERCGLSKGTLYLYFNSKVALFNGLIETIAKPNQSKLIEMMTLAPSAESAITAITEFMPHLIEHSQIPRLIKILVGDSGAFPEIVQQYKVQVIEQALTALAEVFKRSNESGETRIAEPELFSRLMVAPVIFSAVWKAVFAQPDNPGFDMSGLFKLHQKIMLNALNLTLEIES